MSYDPTQPVPPPLEPTQREDGLTPPPPPPPPFDPRTLPYYQTKPKVQLSSVIAIIGGALLVLVLLLYLLNAGR